MSPPPLLQIHREGVRPGVEDAYAAIEEDTARLCARQRGPHPYLAAESLTEPKEVWFFNGFADEHEQTRVDHAYRSNIELIEAMTRNGVRKASLTIAPDGVLARYRGSRGSPWALGHGRFLVITVTREDRAVDGAMFETADGLRIIIESADSREAADAAAEVAGAGTRVFSVRPRWSFPSPSWVSADPQFWTRNGGEL